MKKTKKKSSTVEPLDSDLKAKVELMITSLGNQSRAAKYLGLGDGTLSSALRRGAGRSLRSRISAGYDRWAADHGPGAPSKPKNFEPRPTEQPLTLTVIPPFFQNIADASVNAKRIERLERKIDALLTGFGLDPATIL